MKKAIVLGGSVLQFDFVISAYLYVNAANTIAVSLYQKSGFCVVDDPLEATWVGKNCQIVRMELMF